MNKKNSVLKSVEKNIELEIIKDFNPAEFFQKRKGLYIWNDFKERILNTSTPTRKGFKFTISSFDLKENALDKKIESSLPENHNFDESDVCAVVACLIEKQSKGEEDNLLTNGYANIFYTEAFVVSVRWLGGEWDVGAWYRGDGGWYAGHRVFSPAN